MIIKLFTTPGCSECSQIKRMLDKKQIPFQEYNLSTSDGLAELAMPGVFWQKAPLLVVENGDEYPQILLEKEEQMHFSGGGQVKKRRKKKKKEKLQKRPQNTVKTRRRCLKCNRIFLSGGPGNRLCKACREENKSISGYLDPYRVNVPYRW